MTNTRGFVIIVVVLPVVLRGEGSVVVVDSGVWVGGIGSWVGVRGGGVESDGAGLFSTVSAIDAAEVCFPCALLACHTFGPVASESYATSAASAGWAIDERRFAEIGWEVHESAVVAEAAPAVGAFRDGAAEGVVGVIACA